MAYVDTEGPAFYFALGSMILMVLSLFATIALCVINRLLGFGAFLFSLLLTFVFIVSSSWTLAEDFDD